MDRNLKINLEKIFRNSRSSDEIFDAFQLVVYKKICDPDLFRILLANPWLDSDEIVFFANKLAKDNRELAYDIYFWAGQVMQCKGFDCGCIEKALLFFKKAAEENPSSNLPYIEALKIFNYDIDYAVNEDIIDFAANPPKEVLNKSEIYENLSMHYSRKGENALSRRCKALAEKLRKEENQ